MYEYEMNMDYVLTLFFSSIYVDTFFNAVASMSIDVSRSLESMARLINNILRK